MEQHLRRQEGITGARLYKWILHCAGAAYLFLLLWELLLSPERSSCGRGLNLTLFGTITQYVRNREYLSERLFLLNLFGNIAVFIPFGYLLTHVMKRPRVWKTMVVGLVSISSVEVLQYVTSRGTLDVDDIFLNLLGTLLGYVLFLVLGKRIRNRFLLKRD